ncbi:MAG: nucleotidyltransferase domain-containing protein [Kiritimatiellae bacterium]|nr:nucleotidyltransferase domain-containing protein [Kiritimatiellia bacterium]
MDSQTQRVAIRRRFFSGRPSVRLAFLFGSNAADRATAEFDVDVAVYLGDPGGEERLWRELTRLLDTEVDLVLLDRAPATLVSAVFKQGIALTPGFLWGSLH